MQKAKEYFDKEYGTDHIKEVVEMCDIVSIYGLMEEYAEKCSLLPVSASTPKICSGCGTLSTDQIPEPHLSCCPDSNYVELKQYWLDSKYLR